MARLSDDHPLKIVYLRNSGQHFHSRFYASLQFKFNDFMKVMITITDMG
jgi:hypothetical protein